MLSILDDCLTGNCVLEIYVTLANAMGLLWFSHFHFLFFFCFFSFHFWGAQSAEAARRRANDQLQANKLNIRNPNATAPACQYAGLLLFERTFPKRHLNAPARTCSTSIPIPLTFRSTPFQRTTIGVLSIWIGGNYLSNSHFQHNYVQYVCMTNPHLLNG